MKKAITTIFSTIILLNSAITQTGEDDLLGRQANLNAILTTVPFLTIAPDSRSGALGDAGVATSPDVNSQHYNSSKYVFMEPRSGIALSYTPWLKSLGLTDLNLLYLAGYHKFDEKQSLSGALRYFNLGDIDLRSDDNTDLGSSKPNEFAFDMGYSRLFSEYFSGGLVFRVIYSNIAGSTGAVNSHMDYSAGWSFASDLSVYYQKPIQIDRKDAEYAIGFAITNIGTKMAYSNTDDKEFIPTNMALGGRFSIDLDEYNKISITADLNKLLVPTPPVRDTDTDSIVAGKDDNVGPIRGIFQSFGDAPQGFEEEMQEISYSIGGEYWYREQFAVRFGYFAEHQKKGNRKYLTAGIGLKLNVFALDFSYLIPTSGRNSPLANTMRFTLGFTFE